MDNNETISTEPVIKEKKGSVRKCRYERMISNGVFCFILSFLIPFSVMLYAFSMFGIHPFGDRQILVVDLWHQYFPFFKVVREKLVEGGSFLYSWENGLGTNFLSLISYYAASPLNWIAALFGEESARDAMMFILCAKIGFSGAFFSCFLRYAFSRKDLSVCMFSSMYALCSYVLGYYWNVMWFDTIALFPLVMLGIIAICRERKWKTFTFALALSLVSNYYIGYFTCVFSIFMFASSGIIEFNGIKNWFVSLFIMIRSSILAICLGAFMLLPAYYGLQLTYSANNTMPKNITFYEKWTDIFANLLSYNKPAKVEGLPNFACGMLAVVLFGVFLFAFGIKIREKISALLMLALITVSCNINILNYIWHGFHFTNQIPYRFAFIFSFVLITAAFRAYDIILKKGIKLHYLLFMLIAPAAVFALNYLKDKDEFKFEDAIKSSAIITGAFLLVFAAAKVFPFKSEKVRNSILSLGMTIVVVCELAGNAQIGVDTVTTTGYNDYPTRNEAVQTLLDKVRERDDSPFYRVEMTETYTLNDSALYGYYGLSQFSSAANVSVTTFMRRLGLYASEAGNRYYYRLSTPVVNSLLGLKYFIKKNGMLYSEEMALHNCNAIDNVHLFENKYPLSLGYMMDSDILNMTDSDGSNPFEYQNELIMRATGIHKSIYTPRPSASVRYEDMEATRNGLGNYSFRNEKESGTASAEYTFDGVKNSYLYGYAGCTGGCIDDITIKCGEYVLDNGKLIESHPLVFPMGNAQEDETSTVRITSKDGTKTGNFRLMVYALDQNVFETAYNALADEQLVIDRFSDTEISGAVTAKKDGVLFLSIPYEKGWKVYVDGSETETFPLMQSMLGVSISEGSHDIRIEYTPEGFKTGVMASSAALLVILLLMLLDRRSGKKKAAAISAAEADAEEYIPEQTDGEFFSDLFEDAEAAAVVLYSREEDGEYEKSQSDDGLQGD